MNSLFYQMAEAEAAKPSLLGSLGINVQLLVIQTAAFLVLLWVLSKFVYPALSQMLETREQAIKKSAKAAEEAEQKADETKAEITRLLDEARQDANKILTSAKSEAASVVEAADMAATERAERIIADAHTQIEKDVSAAKKALRDETINLVALATEKVVGKTITPDIDKKVIASAIKDAQ
jgi:F-type H+-transporting ATPase subunit b